MISATRWMNIPIISCSQCLSFLSSSCIYSMHLLHSSILPRNNGLCFCIYNNFSVNSCFDCFSRLSLLPPDSGQYIFFMLQERTLKHKSDYCVPHAWSFNDFWQHSICIKGSPLACDFPSILCLDWSAWHPRLVWHPHIVFQWYSGWFSSLSYSCQFVPTSQSSDK